MRSLMLAMLAAGALMAQTKAVVVRPVLNMFSKPSLDADVVSQTIYGWTVAVVTEESGWTRIRTPGDDYLGWVESSSLRKLKDGETYAADGKAATVESLRAHLYREASVTRHAPVVTLPFEARLEVLQEPPGEGRRWLQLRLPDGAQAWVQRGDLSAGPAGREISDLIEHAKRFLGLPYTWGGTSSFGFDCSGFTQMLLRRGGVEMPRDAQPQADWNQMRAVEKNELRPGDLLYFGANARKITHTGFYIGGGEFIHATANDHPVVQISKLSDPKWTKLLVAQRRWKLR